MDESDEEKSSPLQALKLKPGCTYALLCDVAMTRAAAERIREAAEPLGVRLLVLGPGCSIQTTERKGE